MLVANSLGPAQRQDDEEGAIGEAYSKLAARLMLPISPVLIHLSVLDRSRDCDTPDL